MENVKDILNKVKTVLNKKLEELEALEVEKQDIISRYNNANEVERIVIEKEMRKSEKKFINLLEEVKKTNAKIKMISNDFF